MEEQIAFVTGGTGFIGGRLVSRLRSEGWAVRALVRSESSRRVVEELGAIPVSGGIEDFAAMREGAEGCRVAFHLAAKIGDYEPEEDFWAVNVVGTANAIRACRDAGVSRFVNVSSYRATMGRQPVKGADEQAPLRVDSPQPYDASKAIAEVLVRAAGHPGFETISIRPSWTWGLGDKHLLPEIVEVVRGDRFAWLDGGRHPTATSHVDNVVEALILAVDHGVPGNSYFVSDAERLTVREFVSAQLEAEGVRIPRVSVPVAAVAPAARLVEWLWRRARRGKRPPLTLAGCLMIGVEATVDDSLARAELGYRPVISFEDGIREMREARLGSEDRGLEPTPSPV